jgi:hypothetical protein
MEELSIRVSSEQLMWYLPEPSDISRPLTWYTPVDLPHVIVAPILGTTAMVVSFIAFDSVKPRPEGLTCDVYDPLWCVLALNCDG